MCTVLLPQGVNPIAVNKYIISGNKYKVKEMQDNVKSHSSDLRSKTLVYELHIHRRMIFLSGCNKT